MATQTELYRFSEQGSATVWAYTSGDEEVAYNGDTYTPVSIGRSEVESRNEMSRANLDIKVALTNPAALQWLVDNGERIVTLNIYERTRTGTYNVVWKGRLAGVIPGMDSITLKMESIFTSLRRSGLRARYQRSCRHALYGRGCFVDPESVAVPGTASAVDVTVVTVAEAAGFAAGYFNGGMLRAPSGVLSYIIGHSGSAVTLQRLSFAMQQAVTDGLPFGVTLYPGCAHNRTDCNGKFNNLPNYGGFDFIPQKNPMGGSSIV